MENKINEGLKLIREMDKYFEVKQMCYSNERHFPTLYQVIRTQLAENGRVDKVWIRKCKIETTNEQIHNEKGNPFEGVILVPDFDENIICIETNLPIVNTNDKKLYLKVYQKNPTKYFRELHFIHERFGFSCITRRISDRRW